jgi:hypothetical protein
MSHPILTMQDLKDIIESAIVADLHCAHLTYLDICVRNHVGTNKVVTIAQKYNLTRKRGRVPGRKLYRPVATK